MTSLNPASLRGTAAAALLLLATQSGCEQLPGTRQQQVTAGGALAGAALGAMLADDDNRLLGMLLGGAAGAGGGYLIGANTRWFEGDRSEASARAREAEQDAQRNPATPAAARAAATADIDQDGFVTRDELIAMDQAGFSDQEMLQRLQATDVVFDLTRAQAEQLIADGVSRNVVRQLETLNRDERNQILGSPRS
jgi:hypothetical protein